MIPCFCKENVIRERYHLIEVTFCDYWILFLPCFALSLISLVNTDELRSGLIHTFPQNSLCSHKCLQHFRDS